MRFKRFTTITVALVAVAAILAVSASAGTHRRASAQVGTYCVGGFQALFDEVEPFPLSPTEVDRVVYLREEEKLARDVYLTLAERWQLPIFANIARAEQRHMDLVLLLLELHGVPDPVTDDSVGVFGIDDLGTLFIELTEMGSTDLISALTVGATIEEMDLVDLYDLLTLSDNDHVELIAHNLAKGSRNHLRAFVRALEAQGVTYARQYLDEDTFDAILAADMEQRMYYTADGEPVPACGAGVGGFGMRRGPGQQDGEGGSDGDGDGSGTGECDGTGPNGGGNGGGAGGGI